MLTEKVTKPRSQKKDVEAEILRNIDEEVAFQTSQSQQINILTLVLDKT